MARTQLETLEAFDRELREAVELLDQQLLESALDRATGALALRPGNPLAQNLHGLILFRQGRFRRAHEIFEAVARRNSDIVVLRVNAGLAALYDGNLPRALDHLRRAVDLDPACCRAFGYLALTHLRRGEPDLARAALLEADVEDLATRLDGAVSPEAFAALERELEARAPTLPADSAEEDRMVPAYEGFVEVRPPAADEHPATSAPEPSTPAAPAQDGLTVDAAPASGATTTPVTADAQGELPSAESLEAAFDAITDAAVPSGGAPTASADAEPSSPPEPISAVEILSAAAATTAFSPATEVEWIPTPAASEPCRSAEQPASLLAAQLAAIALPEAASAAALMLDQLLVLRVSAVRGETALLRQDRLVLQRGLLRLDASPRRRKGADHEPFVCQGSAVLRVSGDGLVALDPGAGARLELLHLDQDALFLRESALVACSGDIHYENGRIPGAGAEGPAILHLRGTGFLALRCDGRLVALPVADASAEVRLDAVIGWTAGLVPQQLQRVGECLHLGFAGAGVLMLGVARC